jgi:hypothetical protein
MGLDQGVIRLRLVEGEHRREAAPPFDLQRGDLHQDYHHADEIEQRVEGDAEGAEKFLS